MSFELNNPGNIRIGVPPFRGEFTPSRDPHFRQFQTMKMGIRAMAVILMMYAREHGIDTIHKAIERWAPPSDNNPTDAYAKEVSEVSGYDVDEILDFTDLEVLAAVIAPMIHQENGDMGSITSADIWDAVNCVNV